MDRYTKRHRVDIRGHDVLYVGRHKQKCANGVGREVFEIEGSPKLTLSAPWMTATLASEACQ